MNYYSNVGVIGSGFVGGSVKRYFKGCAWYSLSGGSFEKVDSKEYVFLCLPTPYKEGRGFDLTALRENIERFKNPHKIIIKSTVLPHTTDVFQKMYPRHDFFFNPEFLTAKHAWKDYKNPTRQIVGVSRYDLIGKRKARKILDMLPPSKRCQSVCAATEAEMVKLVANCYLSLRVVFANQMFDYCEQEDVDYDSVIDMVTRGDPRIPTSHWSIFHDGYRGYSGMCFPKDMSAVIDDSNSELLKCAHGLNNKYIKSTKKK